MMHARELEISWLRRATQISRRNLVRAGGKYRVENYCDKVLTGCVCVRVWECVRERESGVTETLEPLNFEVDLSINFLKLGELAFYACKFCIIMNLFFSAYNIVRKD